LCSSEEHRGQDWQVLAVYPDRLRARHWRSYRGPGARREGIWPAAGVMALDVAANWIGHWPSLHEDPARLLRPVGLLPITLFGVFGLVTALPLLRVMKN